VSTPGGTRPVYGDIALVVFLIAQVLDGALTYLGVTLYGPQMEGNPLIAWLMARMGDGPGLATAKITASFFGIVLHLSAEALPPPAQCSSDEQRQARATFDHRSVVNLSSNNYLGLDHAPALRERAHRGRARLRRRIGRRAPDRRHHGDPHGARAAARRVQEGRGGRRLSERLHGQRGHGVGHPRRRRTSIISDELNHASIIDGCRLSRATIKVFPHKDVDAARRIMRSCRPASASCSSPTASSAWTATSARCPRSATSPRSSAAS
jgi:hypothetical protein